MDVVAIRDDAFSMVGDVLEMAAYLPGFPQITVFLVRVVEEGPVRA